MKILYILDSLGTGGAERSTADLWYFLKENNVAVYIVVLGHRKEGIQSEILKQQFSVHFLRSKGIFDQVREIATHIRTIQPTIVHSILFKSNLRTRLARMTTKFLHLESLVNCTYDPIRLKDPKVTRLSFYFYKYLDLITARWVDHFHAITQVVKEHYHDKLNIPLDKISVIHRGRNENKFLNDRLDLRTKYKNELGLSNNIVLIIHVGRQEYQKGHLVLLKAINQLSDDVLDSSVFLFLGRDGNSTPAITSFISKNPSKGKLMWLGHRHDVAEFLAAADIFVFPSLYEGLGGALIEAQAAGLPIICTDLPVLNEVVLKEQNALMHKDDIDLAGQLSKLISNESLRMEMGIKGLANFRQKFSMGTINRLSFEFYKELAK